MFILSLGGEDIADIFVDEDTATAMIDVATTDFREKVKSMLSSHFPERKPHVSYYGIDYT